VLCQSRIDSDRFAVSVYALVRGCQQKVLSARVTSKPQFFDPSFYKNCEGCVGVMSWRRGEWENVILVQCFENEAQGFWDLVHNVANTTLH
jgi:hypothetical protein